jgi:cbb3-type cytochrome oxidase maturation protein
VLFIVVPLALLVALAAVLAYVWAARRGQLDDLVTPAWRMLNDDAGATVRNPEPGREGATSAKTPDSD